MNYVHVQTSFKYFTPVETNSSHELLHYNTCTLQGNKGDGGTNRRTVKKTRQPNKSMMLDKKRLPDQLEEDSSVNRTVLELTSCEVKTVSGFV